jgi:hypothetical protein
MNRYECPYICDGVEHTVVIWAASESEAADKMRALPWQPGNGPLPHPPNDGRDSRQGAAALLLALAVLASITALTFRHADEELKQVAVMMHFKHFAHPSGQDKIIHQA